MEHHAPPTDGEAVRRALAGRPIGPHLPLGPGLLKAADRAAEIGAGAVQVFTDNPTAWRRRREPPAKLAEFRARLAAHGIGPVAVHAPYLINLAGPDETFWQQSIETLVTDMRAAAGYGARFLNFHAGSHRGTGRNAGIARLAAGMAAVLAEVPTHYANDEPAPLLVVENSPGSGDAVGTALEDLADVLEALAATGTDTARVGVCLDTAHLWAAGYALDDPDEVDRLAGRAAALLGDRLVMLHVNDARAQRGARIDRHEHLGAGGIGGRGLRRLLDHELLRRLPAFLETPGMDAGYDGVNLERVARLLAGDDLPVLPAEAFTLRGSRARTPPGDRPAGAVRAAPRRMPRRTASGG
jgi:deoxyribonuclease IV